MRRDTYKAEQAEHEKESGEPAFVATAACTRDRSHLGVGLEKVRFVRKGAQGGEASLSRDKPAIGGVRKCGIHA